MRAIGPSFSIGPVQIGRLGVERQAGLLADGGQELHDGVGEHQRKLVAAQPGNSLSDGGDRVVVVHHRAVPAPAAGGQPHPLHALLGRLDQVEAALTAVAARHRQRKAADLADRLSDAVEQIGPIVDQPVRPVATAVLLVGHEGEHQVAWRHDAGLLQLPGDHDRHAHHVLHVDRAAAPDVAVFDRARERVHAPFGRFGRHDVEMPMDQQGATGSVGALQAGEHISPAGRTGFNVFRPVAHLGKLLGDPLAHSASPCVVSGSPVLVVSNRINLLTTSDHVVAGVAWDCGLNCHSHQSYHCAGRLRLGRPSCRLGRSRADPLALAANPCGWSCPSGGMADALA